MKTAFTKAPILFHPDPSKPFCLEAYALDFALGVVLSQYRDDGRLHPVGFHSRIFLAIEFN